MKEKQDNQPTLTPPVIAVSGVIQKTDIKDTRY